MNFDNGHRGNLNLKRIGDAVEWTPEMVKEYVKCSQDPIYFARKYIKIVHVDKGLIPLDMYDYQEEIVTKFNASRRLLVATSRQIGKCVINSTTIKLRNKKTGEVKEMTVGDFYNTQQKVQNTDDVKQSDFQTDKSNSTEIHDQNK